MDTNAADLEAEQPADPRWVSMGRGATALTRWGGPTPPTEAPGQGPVPAYDWLSDGESAPVDTALTPIDHTPAVEASTSKVRSGWGGRRRAAEPTKRSAFSRPGDRPRPG